MGRPVFFFETFLGFYIVESKLICNFTSVKMTKTYAILLVTALGVSQERGYKVTSKKPDQDLVSLSSPYLLNPDVLEQGTYDLKKVEGIRIAVLTSLGEYSLKIKTTEILTTDQRISGLRSDLGLYSGKEMPDI